MTLQMQEQVKTLLSSLRKSIISDGDASSIAPRLDYVPFPPTIGRGTTVAPLGGMVK